MRRTAGLALLTLCLGCHRAGRRPGGEPELAGIEVQLILGSFRWAAPGRVGSMNAEVVFEVSQLLSTVTRACFPGAASLDEGPAWELPLVPGGVATVREVVLGDAEVAGVRLTERKVGLADGEECVLTLGLDVLEPYALELRPETRRLVLRPSQGRDGYRLGHVEENPGEEAWTVALARAPETDWPLVAVRLKQARAELTGPFVVSTALEETLVAAPAASEAGLLSIPDLFTRLGFPANLSHTGLSSSRYSVEEVALSKEARVSWLSVAGDEDWSRPGIAGRLGADVLARFHTVVDLGANVLVLRRPRVGGQTGRECTLPGGTGSEEACFVLSPKEGNQQPAGAVLTVWRDLENGARVDLEPLTAAGTLLATDCRLGFSLGKTGRGGGMSARFPWADLDRELPGCAEALKKAASFRLALFEEEPSPECSGACAFVRSVPLGQTACLCRSGSRDPLGHDAWKLLRLYRDALEKGKGRLLLPELNEPEDEPDSP